MPPAILEELRGLGFTWTRIAKMLNVTIHRRMTDHGLEGLSQFSDITDAELDHVIEDYFLAWAHHRSILHNWAPKIPRTTSST